MFKTKSKRNMEYVVEVLGNRQYINFRRLIKKTRGVVASDRGVDNVISDDKITSAIKKAEKKGLVKQTEERGVKLYRLSEKC